LPGRFGIPALYVSHDIDEVARLADRLLVLADGRVRTHGETTDVVERLDLQPVTGRFEAGVLVEGRVEHHDRRLHLTEVAVGDDAVVMPLASRLAPGAPVRLRIRARDVALATVRPEGLSIRNVLPGTLTELVAEPESAFVEARVALSGARLRSRITRAAAEALALRPGMSVYALVKSVSFEGAA
ncbi:MAG: TOBE domain-containing protein, partial [Pseudomonadota bacterium]